MLTAWGFAGVLGPMLVAWIRQSTRAYSHALHIIGVITLVSAVIPLVVRPPMAPSPQLVSRPKAA